MIHRGFLQMIDNSKLNGRRVHAFVRRRVVPSSIYPDGTTGYAQPSCLRLTPSFQILVMCRIRSRSKSMT